MGKYKEVDINSLQDFVPVQSVPGVDPIAAQSGFREVDPATLKFDQQQPQTYPEKLNAFSPSKLLGIEDFVKTAGTGAAKLPVAALQGMWDLAASTTDPQQQGIIMKGIGATLSNLPGLSPERKEALKNITVNDFRQNLADFTTDLNQIEQKAAESSPIAAPAGSAFGGAAPLAALGPVTGGALIGALQPQTEVKAPAEALSARAGGATEGALTGYVGGKAVEKLAPAIGAVGKKIVKAPAGVAQGVAQVPGVVTRIAKGRDADTILAERIRGNLDTVLEDLESGTISTLADVGDRNVRALARKVGKVSDDALNIIDSALKGRSNEAVERVTKDLSKSISHADNYFNTLDDIVAVRSKMAAPLYKKAYQEGGTVASTRIDTLLKDKRIIDAIDEAKTNLGVRAEAPANSIETLDGAKKALDDIIGEAMRTGKNQKAASYQILKNDLVKELDAASPTYAKARKVFSDFKSVEDAQKLGLDIFKQQPQQIKNILKGMDNTQKEALKIGAREALQRVVYTTKTGADPAKRIFGNSLQKQQLKALFNNPKEYAQFEKRMMEEIRAAETKFDVIGGSRSDLNLADTLADDAEFIEMAAEAARRGVVATTIDKTIGAVADAVSRRYIGLTPSNSKELAKILTDRKASIDAVKRLIAAEKSVAQKRLMTQVAKEHGAKIFNQTGE